MDYDPGASRINQENRIKLMLAIAHQQAEEEKSGPTPSPAAPQEERVMAG